MDLCPQRPRERILNPSAQSHRRFESDQVLQIAPVPIWEGTALSMREGRFDPGQGRHLIFASDLSNFGV